MLNSEVLDELRHIALGQKEKACAKRPMDIETLLCGFRGNDLVAFVVCPVDRDRMLMAAGMMAVGMSVDVIGSVFETYTAGYDLANDPERSGQLEGLDEAEIQAKLKEWGIVVGNPLTGKEWGKNEMQDVADNHGGIEKGWVSEAICLSAVNRAGDVALATLKYHYVGGRYLSWEDPIQNFDTGNGDGQALGGFVFDEMRRFMNLPAVSVTMPPDFPLDEDDRDVATAQWLTRKGFTVLLAASRDQKYRISKLRRAGEDVTRRH